MVKDLHSRLDDCRARDLDDVADEVLRLQADNAALRELAQWMTGCGYDFTQWLYYRERQHLLSDTALAPAKEQP